MTDREKRCEDCICLVVKGKDWCCEECFGQNVNDIDDCPEGIELETITALNEKAKENKISKGARSDKKTDRKPREQKQDTEKETILQNIADLLTLTCENVEITNKTKIIEFDLGGNHFKLDLIRQRKGKK